MIESEENATAAGAARTAPVVAEIIRNAFLAAVEDMRATLWRSACSRCGRMLWMGT